MQKPRREQGASLIEVLIASSLFSLFVLQAIALSLQWVGTVRTALQDTQAVILEESQYRIKRSQSGFTLLEIMISMALSLTLSLGFFHAVTLINRIYHQHEALSHIQENARAIHFILTELYTSQDSMGCNKMGEDHSVVLHSGLDEALWVKKSKMPALKHPPRTGSDVIWVNYAKNTSKWKKGTVLALSSCRETDLFVLQEDDHLVVAKRRRMGRVYQYHSVLLYVADTDRKDEKGQPIYALYTTDLNGKTRERVEGVEKMKVTKHANGETVQILLTYQNNKMWWTWEF